MLYQFTLCCLLVLGFGWLLWRLCCILMTPVHPGHDTGLTVLVTARDDAPELEALLQGLLWLRDSGTLEADICVLGGELGAEASALAEKLAAQHHALRLMNNEEVLEWIQIQTKPS